MNKIKFNISTLLGVIVFSILFSSCNSIPQTESEPQKEHVQPHRTVTITLLSDSCAKEQIELAIQQTRVKNPEIGFNLYYSKNGIPQGQVVNLEFIKCGSDSLTISENTSETPEIETFISLIQP